jgi:hypothetical protein
MPAQNEAPAGLGTFQIGEIGDSPQPCAGMRAMAAREQRRPAAAAAFEIEAILSALESSKQESTNPHE